MELKGCTAIVTGGSGGLGQRICHALARNGVNVVVNYAASEAKAKGVAEEAAKHGVRAIAIKADVTDVAAVNHMVEQTKKEFGRIDILINNAADNKEVAFTDIDGLTHEFWNHIMNVNLTGTLNCIKAVAPIMRAQGQGRIVNISSGAGLLPRGSSIAYAVSKAGMIHLDQMHGSGAGAASDGEFHCAGFHGGYAHDRQLGPEMQAGAASRTLLKRTVDKDEIAEQTLMFCRSDCVTGQTLLVDSGRV